MRGRGESEDDSREGEGGGGGCLHACMLACRLNLLVACWCFRSLSYVYTTSIHSFECNPGEFS
jgi:hypothetical protein